MSTKIRLARGGAKKKPHYSVVVTASRSPRDSKIIERIGTYNPMLAKDNENRVVVDAERAKHWLGVGAQPTDVVSRLFRTKGIITTKAMYRGAPKLSKKAQKEAANAPAAPAA